MAIEGTLYGGPEDTEPEFVVEPFANEARRGTVRVASGKPGRAGATMDLQPRPGDYPLYLRTINAAGRSPLVLTMAVADHPRESETV